MKQQLLQRCTQLAADLHGRFATGWAEAPSAPAHQRHAELMAQLRLAHGGISETMRPGSRIVYLDYPTHYNVGDLLINLGTEAFFRRMDYRVLARQSVFDLCDCDRLMPVRATLRRCAVEAIDRMPKDVALVFHGGGNFGDLYPEFQAARELVIQRYPGRRIVLLPQSMHFSSEQRQRESLSIFARHPDLQLFLRDHNSLRAAKDAGLRATLMPDMAHALWGSEPFIGPAAVPTTGTRRLELRRTDDETAALPLALSGRSMDWPDLASNADDGFLRVIRGLMLKDMDPSYRLTYRLWYLQRDRIVGRARALYLAHDSVRTDRLHGLILGALLAMPTYFSDNSYGKLSRYVEAFLKGSPLVMSDPSAGPASADRGHASSLWSA